MRRRPTRSTLFPYTDALPISALAALGLARSVRAGTLRDLRERRPAVLLPVGVLRRAPERGDRKSTRLNSSHANNSYAVFCLKKKNCIEEKRMKCRRKAKWNAH